MFKIKCSQPAAGNYVGERGLFADYSDFPIVHLNTSDDPEQVVFSGLGVRVGELFAHQQMARSFRA